MGSKGTFQPLRNWGAIAQRALSVTTGLKRSCTLHLNMNKGISIREFARPERVSDTLVHQALRQGRFVRRPDGWMAPLLVGTRWRASQPANPFSPTPNRRICSGSLPTSVARRTPPSGCCNRAMMSPRGCTRSSGKTCPPKMWPQVPRCSSSSRALPLIYPIQSTPAHQKAAKRLPRWSPAFAFFMDFPPFCSTLARRLP
jgi:hypothetical protein